MPRGNHRQRASITIDAVVAVGLTLLMAAMFTATVLHYGRAVRLDDAREELRRAAETELLRLRADGVDAARETAKPAATLEPESDIKIATETAAGEGVWCGMTRVTIRASHMRDGGRLVAELSAYLPATEDRP